MIVFVLKTVFLKTDSETGLPCSAISCNRFHLTCWRSTWSRIQNQQAGGINLLAASEIMLCFKTITACNLLERCIYVHKRFSVLKILVPYSRYAPRDINVSGDAYISRFSPNTITGNPLKTRCRDLGDRES